MASPPRPFVLETFFPGHVWMKSAKGVSALLLIGSFSSLSSSLPFFFFFNQKREASCKGEKQRSLRLCLVICKTENLSNLVPVSEFCHSEARSFFPTYKK